MNLRNNEESFVMIEISSEVTKKRYLCEIQGTCCNKNNQEEMEATIMDVVNNPWYNFNVSFVTKDCKVDQSYEAMTRALCSQKVRKSSFI